MTTLTQHIENINAKTQAWIDEDPKNRWGGMLSTDLDHWAGYGITTVEQFERYQLETSIWDAYKDAHGVRPRGIDFASMSMDELEKFAQDTYAALETEMEREAAQEQKNIQEFENFVEEMMTSWNIDRQTAIRWVLDSKSDGEVYYDGGYACYCMGLPYSRYEKEFDAVLKIIQQKAAA